MLLFSCGLTNVSNIELLCKLPKKLQEVSGIQTYKNGSFLYAIQDSGNGSLLYELTYQGKKKRVLEVLAENKDWEDLTSDTTGNLYLGDFGNNENKREDLCIYKINPSNSQNEILTPEYKVSFYYPEQKRFPPSKKELFYDCEAFFEYHGFFYLFTKNRSKGFDGTSMFYKVPNTPGNHAAQLLGTYKTGENYNVSAITGAAISPDGSKFVLLSHSKIWLFENYKGDDFLNGTITKCELHHYSKKEAVCFQDNDTLLIADEKDKATGGNIYKASLGRLKAKP